MLYTRWEGGIYIYTISTISTISTIAISITSKFSDIVEWLLSRLVNETVNA